MAFSIFALHHAFYQKSEQLLSANPAIYIVMNIVNLNDGGSTQAYGKSSLRRRPSVTNIVTVVVLAI